MSVGQEPTQDATATIQTVAAKDQEALQLFVRANQSADPDERIALARQAHDLLALAPANAPGLTAAALFLGQMLLVQDEPVAALPFFQECVQLWQGQPPAPQGAIIFGGLGETARRLNDLPAALTAFEQALGISRALSDQLGTVDHLLDIGLVLAQLNRTGEAIKRFDEAVSVSERLGDIGRESRALHYRAYIRFKYQSDLANARKDWEKVTRIAGEPDRAWAWSELSGLDLVQGRFQDGIDAVNRALDYYKAQGLQRDVALNTMKLADLTAAAGDIVKAESLYEEAAKANQVQGSPDLELRCLSQAASLAWHEGHLEEAIVRYERVVARALVAGVHDVAAVCCGALATIHRSLKRDADADKYLTQGAQEWSLITDPSWAVENWIAQARNTANGRRYQEALNQLEATLAALEPESDQYAMARLHRVAADIAVEGRDPAVAISHAQAAVRLYESLDMPENLVIEGLNLAEIYVDAAQSAQRTALDVALERKLPDAARIARTALSKSLFNTGSFSEAREQLRAALSHGGSRNPLADTHVRIGLSLVAERLGDDWEAMRELQKAAKALDAFRLDFAMPELAASYIGSLTNIYSQLVRAALRTGRLELAFDYAEQARSRALLRLTGFTQLPTPASIRPQLAAKEGEALKDASSALVRLHANQADPDALTQLRAAYGRLEAVWKAMGPSEYVALRRGDATTYQEAKEALASESRRVVLVEFVCRDTSTLVFGVRPDSQVPEVVSLELDQAALGRFVRRNFGEHGSVRELAQPDHERGFHQYDFLIAPIARWAKPGDVVYLVPHRLLHYLPLHALTLEDEPLIARNPIAYLPSASVLPYCLAKRTHDQSATTAAVFGDSRSNLPDARREAEQVAMVLKTKAAVGKDVTAAAFHKAANADVIHFAGHAFFDVREPLKSCLALAGKDIVTARDFFGLQDLRASLVGLSGCETGVSDVRPGDELMGLTRPLLATGARSLLVSLWQVADASTGFLMKRFYANWRESPKLTKAEALQRAILDTRDRRAWQSFYYWAAFVLIGDWR